MSSVKRDQMVKLQLSARKLANMDYLSISDPYLIVKKNNFQVRKTETRKNTLNPDWGFLYISLQELCDSDTNMKLEISIYDEDRGDDQLIGTSFISVSELQDLALSGSGVDLHHDGRNRGQLLVKVCQVDQPTFQERVSNFTATYGYDGLKDFNDLETPETANLGGGGWTLPASTRR